MLLLEGFVTISLILPKLQVQAYDSIETFRLSDNIQPSSYNLRLIPYLLPENDKKQFTFDGTVSIILSTDKDNLTEIFLHKKDMVIDESESTFINQTSKKDIKIIRTEFNSTTDKYKLVLQKDLVPKVDYKLTLKFKGHMRDNMLGFYRSSYINANGEMRWIGATQFNHEHTRRAFPCFDEPKFKAVFNITLVHEFGYTTLSNMKSFRSQRIGKKFETTFLPTPKMSSYLVAFLVSDFEERSDHNQNFSIIARIEGYSETKYSLNVGQKILVKLNEYMGLNYDALGNKKIHMAAIPDFAAGAMENWGLIKYKEKLLLYNETETSDWDQQRIATVIAHELSHMWFGNYVTLEWWSYLWLNEGFARYFEYFTTNEIYPEWQLEKQFIVDQIHTSFVKDSLSNTIPMSYKVISQRAALPAEFTTISYNKGGSVIRMFKHCMGESNFKSALNEYLKAKQYNWSIPEDLFNVFKEKWTNNHINIQEYFLDWTEQVGYPVVNIQLSEDHKSINVSQKRFLLEKDAGYDSILYTIPFTYTTNLEKDFNIPSPEKIHFLRKTKNAEKINLGKSSVDWVVGNIQQLGYFRVNYDENTWYNLYNALLQSNWSNIPDINRAHIVDDLFNFGRSGILKYNIVFKVLEYLETEINYLPWTAAFNGFSYLEQRLGSNRNIFGPTVLKLLDKVYKKLGFVEKLNEKRLDIYNRNKVLSWLCRYDHEECNVQALDYISKLKDKNELVPKNIRSSVYCSGLRKINENYQYFVEKYENSTVATEQSLILTALGCVKSKENIKIYYDYILSNKIRRQDKSAVMTSLISGNPANAEIVFNLISEDHKKLGEAFGNGDGSVVSVLSTIASRFTKEDQKQKFQKFIEDEENNLSSSAKSSLKNIVKEIEKNLEWTKTYLPDILEALRNSAAQKFFSFSVILLTLILLFLIQIIINY